MGDPIICPVCGKKAKTGSAIDCARHMFGTGDKPHRQWVDAQGLSFIDLLIEQATTPGNKSYELLAEYIEKDAQKKAAEKKG
ncbi:MAG: hypothetical protein A2Z19_05785 [Deltaproteobacteria bacterium RBG_16_54_18]|jgi:hypothetical protein|nr:MAG: hypothetical protein A2Z19_05785 [Deltaproteobacteria bacterium RBG_16_54_18]